MSKCCRELNPLFDLMACKTVEQQSCEEGSAEWEELDNELQELYKRECNIFLHYNPEYRRNGKKTNTEVF